ncbi:MAG: hypothetical protein QG593_523 [Patescibacteria group bacterium]|jgi:hypothetical protein|nr:hypothetical protein [Patescibacteria group bacterium]
MASKKDFHKVVIGRAELLHFLDFEIVDIPAKTDTGAYRSAIHAANIKVIDDTKLQFEILGGHPVCGKLSQTITADKFKKVGVANSFGHREDRYEVWLKVKLGPRIFRASFTLADRSKKIYPILLGRKLLNGRFLVDTSETSINRVELKRQYGIDMPDDEEVRKD